MGDQDGPVERFEASRNYLQAVAYRMLGAPGDADDAVQETWIRFSQADTSSVDNLGGWLTTVVSRVCLDMLRSRTSRHDDAGRQIPDIAVSSAAGSDPEHEALLADSVGPALLVVLEALTPAERLALVLHDLFAVPFDDIGPLMGRSPDAAKQLASRARRKVRRAEPASDPDAARQRAVVDAFLAASRNGDVDALLAILDPDAVIRADSIAVRFGALGELRGAATDNLCHRAALADRIEALDLVIAAPDLDNAHFGSPISPVP